MAAEVPVSDILCEAMEYLSKLGSNLQTRSNNLKDKRIRKDKLKNNHAVHKAASKVLLICELSKKSLDNVETGVRKVLSLLESSQAPLCIGGNTSDTDTNKNIDNDKYDYLDNQSGKIRIKKKIPLKHYMSVKVLARRMPASMQQKYPVYLDCKLKRQRRRVAELKTMKSRRLSDKEQGNAKGYTENKSCGDMHSNLERNENSEAEEDTISKNTSKDGNLNENNEKHQNVSESTKENVINKETDDQEFIKNKSRRKSTELSTEEKADKNIIEKETKIDDQHEIHSKEKKKITKKKGRVRFADLVDSDTSTQENNVIEAVDLCSDDENLLKSPNKSQQVEAGDNDVNQLALDLDVNNDISNGVKQSENTRLETKSLDSSQNNSDAESRPLIRCVNLSKLLKPDLISTKGEGSDKIYKKTETSAGLIKKINNKNDEAKRKQKKDEYENWVKKKRKETNKFKPKKFSINIKKLPNLDIKFLLAHNLKRITTKGNIICEVQETDTPKKIEAVKKSLLNDSDSDSGEDEVKSNEESRLNNSEYNPSKQEHSKKSECKSKKHKQDTNIDSVKEKLLEDSDNNEDASESGRANTGNELVSDKSPIPQNNTNKGCKEFSSPSNNEDDDMLSLIKDIAEGITIPSKNTSAVASTTTNQEEKQINGQTKKESKINSNKTTDELKSSLLNSSSDEEINKNNEIRTATENNKENPSSVNSPSDDDFVGSSKSTENIRPPLLNDPSDNNKEKTEADTPTKNINEVKSSLLNDSSDDQNRNEERDNINTNEKIKSSLLCNSSGDENGRLVKLKEAETEAQKESSDVKSDSSDDNRDKHKTPKYKRRYARKIREAKKRPQYSSSSDSDREKHRHKRHKLRISSSSSSSDHVASKSKKLKKSNIISDDSDNSKQGTTRTIDQVDGADELSNTSNDKMVRSKAKPSGSSSQNSDSQDASDKDVDRLTNLNNLNKSHRPESSAKSREGKDSTKNKQLTATPIIGEDILKSESSSNASDEEHDVDEELPPVTLPGLNGDSISHIAQEDLLGESDSSVSHNEKDQSEHTEKDETDGEQNLKLKRRKANTISSDSEGGSHRPKQQDNERMSDFEDSEDDSSEPAKKSKRKKKVTDSDASGDSSDGGKKKRRRIKTVRDSDASGSDTENEGRNKHGRKNIRKVMGKNQLEEATKKAAREEKERVARIAERQKLYNNLDFDESGKPDEVVLEKVVLDFDPETKEPLIQVDRGLVKKLKPHQANGIKFMWDACFESVKRIKKDKGSGCILAHCMGLGKTLQVISLTHTLLTHASLTGVNRVLVVCPLSTVLNWVNEFRMWLKHAEAEFEVDVYELSRYKQNSERAFQLQQWLDGGGVCVLGYEMFRNLSADNSKKFKKKMLRSFQESLVDPGPDLVVCDEGHLLKNEKTSLSQSMNRVKTRRRIVLTGTPLQNNLKEYYCMVQFVKPNLLGKYNEYLNRFVNPITNGQYTDSTEHDIRVMKRRSHVLHKMLDGAVQRRDYGVLAPFLPPKHEYVLFITLSDVQVKLYQHYLENYSRRPLPGKSSGFLFPDFQSLQRIWTHPLVLKYNSERYEIMQQKKREREEEDSEGSLVDFIDDDSTPDESSTEESSDDLSDMSDDSRKKSKKKKAAKKSKAKETKASTRRGTRANPVEVDEDVPETDDLVEVKYENPTEWWIKLVEESELEDMRNSHKLVLLFDILRQCETIGDKLLVFSQSLYSLDLIEHFLGKVDEATQEGRIDEKLGGHVGSWSPGVDYFRLDGSTSCENRSIWCKNFNREDNPRARLFLISTRAGGLGINLVAANRVVIFDVSWNPSHDVQSIFRVYRFGQKKPCYVYRFLAMGTMEEKIYERQVTKQAISKRVIDEQQIDRHYAENDLAELYKFEARPDEPRPIPTLPKDRLFAEMLREHEAQIYKYHEHDSLLENKEEETLSEEERKAAWEDFENEKNKPPPAPFPSAWPMHNGMVPGLLAQQQQQLAYAALAAMLRKDMPNINDNQIRDMLPLIYNSNPGMFAGYDYGLMQKMSEIYKYAQPGMMNPGMMNPVMNAGSGAGAGMGGTSGLQYEPPWQRQHQQQQQMRLQQIMQQQNQMGAKFYAGGLGSRDPVAMALQQQRAREIMMGGGGTTAGRPRGRPPIHPRLPTTTSSDVVNLDSD